MEDKDNIRVDLLKFRRKAYLEYPEGSPERKNFLKIILQNELRLTEMEMPKEIVTLVIEGDKMVFWQSMRSFSLWAIPAFLLYFIGFLLQKYHWNFIFYLLGSVLLAKGTQYFYEYWLYRKSMKTVQQYSQDMNQYINKISNDIKRLEGPR
jgi:hypothetical protein